MSVDYLGNTTGTTSLISITLSTPTETVGGSMMVAVIVPRQTSNAVVDDSGEWTDRGQITVGSGDGIGVRLAVFTKVADADDAAGGTSYTFSYGTGVRTSASLHAISAAAVNVVGTQQTGSGVTATALGVTTTVDDCLLFAIGACQSTFIWTPPTGFTEQLDFQHGDGNGTSHSVATVLQSLAEASGDKDFTVSSSSADWMTQLLAFEEAAGPHNPGIITQPHGAWFQQRYGSFAGKAADAGSGPHNPGLITQPHGAWFQRRYGSFAGKSPSGEPAAARRTRPILLLRDTGRLAPGL